MRTDLWTCHLGQVEYREALELQRRLRTARQAGAIPDLLLLLEHPPVYTRGRRSVPGELPMGESWYLSQGIDVVDVDRGGKVTYHGPGQLVGYPIMAVDDVVAFVRTMEEAMIAALADEGIAARSRADEGRDFTGVWVDERKIGSIGVHVQKGVATHGFAVNVQNDLQPFEWVVPCGLEGVRMTSVLREQAAAATRSVLPQADGLAVRRGLRAAAAPRHPAASRGGPGWPRPRLTRSRRARPARRSARGPPRRSRRRARDPPRRARRRRSAPPAPAASGRAAPGRGRGSLAWSTSREPGRGGPGEPHALPALARRVASADDVVLGRRRVPACAAAAPRGVRSILRVPAGGAGEWRVTACPRAWRAAELPPAMPSLCRRLRLRPAPAALLPQGPVPRADPPLSLPPLDPDAGAPRAQARPPPRASATARPVTADDGGLRAGRLFTAMFAGASRRVDRRRRHVLRALCPTAAPCGSSATRSSAASRPRGGRDRAVPDAKEHGPWSRTTSVPDHPLHRLRSSNPGARSSCSAGDGLLVLAEPARRPRSGDTVLRRSVA